MKYKQAGMIGVALSLALTALACSKIASNSTPPSDVSKSSNLQPSQTPAVVTDAQVRSKPVGDREDKGNKRNKGDKEDQEDPSPQPTTYDQTPYDQIPYDRTPYDLTPNAPLSYKLETYNSKAMRGRRTYGIVLPPGYEQNPTQRYPVIFLLHGGHGSPTSWFEQDKGAAITTLEQLYAAGKLPPSIIITPDGNDRRGTSPYWDPQYIDGPNGKVLTAIGDELVKVVQSRYRTLPTPNFWAIGGLSSGAWGATNVGLHNPNHFSIIFSHSGYFRDASGPRNSPMTFVRKLSPQKRRQLRIYLDTGRSDNISLKQNRQFHQILNQLKIKNVLREFPGEHTWQYWREHLADSLTFVSEQFQLATQAKPSENQGLDSPTPSPQ